MCRSAWSPSARRSAGYSGRARRTSSGFPHDAGVIRLAGLCSQSRTTNGSSNAATSPPSPSATDLTRHACDGGENMRPMRAKATRARLRRCARSECVRSSERRRNACFHRPLFHRPLRGPVRARRPPGLAGRLTEAAPRRPNSRGRHSRRPGRAAGLERCRQAGRTHAGRSARRPIGSSVVIGWRPTSIS
jgi:hypothetical protein